MSEPNLENDENRVLLHLMVVGFHHKKGCLVEYCYPPLDSSLLSVGSSPEELQDSRSSTPAPPAQSEDVSTTNESSRGQTQAPIPTVPTVPTPSIRLPALWQTLPSLAIPDGAHNYDSDTVFFNLPSLTPSSSTIYAVACYRQIATKELRIRTPEMTRSSVQKSLVALLRLPLYGLVELKLEIITRAYFAQGDFTQTGLLAEAFTNLNRSLSPTLLHTPEALTGLSVRALFARFGSQVILLFKLLLLERKTIFIMSPIRELSNTILTLCSLIPGLIQEGLTQSTIPFNVKSSGSSVNLGQLKRETSERGSPANLVNGEPSSGPRNASTQAPGLRVPKSASTHSFSSPILDPLDPTSPGPSDESEEEAARRLEAIFTRPHLYYGLPLSLFTCSAYLLPYFSMPYFDVLTAARVRSCVAGSSNQIFKRWESDIDVYVTDNQIEVEDVALKRILRPTAEDGNFMNFLMKTISESDHLSGDLFDESATVFCEGSDEWIRCHFKNYLLHLMRCSTLDETSREYRAFNPFFMAAWKETHNYKTWASGPYTGACTRDIDPAHPFTGHRLSNLKFKLANLFNSRQEYLNASAQKAALTNVLSTARTTVNSWLGNLGSLGLNQISKGAAATSSWNSFLSTAASVSGGKTPSGPESNPKGEPSRTASPAAVNPKPKPTTPTTTKEKDSFIFYPASNSTEPEEDETSV